jgi:hypothetical protein
VSARAAEGLNAHAARGLTARACTGLGLGLLLGALALGTAGCASIVVEVELYTQSPQTSPQVDEVLIRAAQGLRTLRGELAPFAARCRQVAQDTSPRTAARADELLGELELLAAAAESQVQGALALATRERESLELPARLDLDLRLAGERVQAAVTLENLAARLETHFAADGAPQLAGPGEATWALEGGADLAARGAALRSLGPELAALAAALADVDAGRRPDLRADDGDPFLREIAAGRVPRAQVFRQEAAADGDSSFLLVRETPVRFTLHRASSDPGDLVRAQLRLARTGLDVLSSLAGLGGGAGPELDGLRRQLSEAGEEGRRADERRQTLAAELEAVRAALRPLEQEEQLAERRLSSLEARLTALRTDLRLEGLEARRQHLDRALEKLEGRLLDRRTERAQALAELATRRTARLAALERYGELRRALEIDRRSGDVRFSDLVEEYAALPQQIEAHDHAARELESSLGALELALAADAAEQQALAESRAATQAELQEQRADPALVALEEELAQARAARAAAAAALRQLFEDRLAPALLAAGQGLRP